MTRLLIFEPSYRRLESQINTLGSGLASLLMAADGSITLDGAPVLAEDAAPDVAWLNADLFGSPAARPYMAALTQAPALKWMQSAAAGYDHPVFGQLVSKGARLTTSHGQALGMADYVLAGVLDHFQAGPARRAAQAKGVWERHTFRELKDTHWLIIGFGSIGRETAVRARGFGARITGVRRNPEPHPAADAVVTQDQIAALLPSADVVVLSLPLSAATHHMVDAEFLKAMKAGSVLANVGRGGLVDEPALLAALDAGTPEHAVLDVFETEPLPADSPLWRHPRVALTPHSSGMSNGPNGRNEALFLDNLRQFMAGEPLVNEAKPEDVLAS